MNHPDSEDDYPNAEQKAEKDDKTSAFQKEDKNNQVKARQSLKI